MGTLSIQSIFPTSAFIQPNIYQEQTVNKQQVFADDDDYMHFLSVLRRQTQSFGDEQGQFILPRCYVYPYCLMGNLCIFSLKRAARQYVDTMKRIATAYVCKHSIYGLLLAFVYLLRFFNYKNYV